VNEETREMNAPPSSPLDATCESLTPADEAQFAAIIEFSGDAIISKTPGGIITSWSSGAERIFGYTAAEAIGQAALFLIPPDRVYEEQQVLARVARGEGVNEFETVRLRKDGAAITVWVSLAPIKDDHGRLIGISNVARDITVRHREEEALRLSEARYRRFFESAPDGILILDADTGQVVDANPFMQELLGYSLEEFMGKKLWEIGPFTGIAANKLVFAELKIKDRVRYESLLLERQDGRRVEAEFISDTYVAAQRRLIQCNVRDITERKREEEALRLSEARYRRLFETAQDGILVLDASTGQVVDANPFMQALLGYTLGEFIGKKLWEIGPFKRIDASKTVFAGLQLKDTVRYESLPLEKQDGGRVEAEFISNAYVAAERRLIQCTIRDITARNREERVLREKVAALSQLAAEVSDRTAELESTNKELESFSYSVSHDLRAPLRSIDGFSRILLEDYADKLDDEGKDHLQRVRAASQRMGHLIDDLLKLSHVTRLEMRRSPVDLSAVARDIAEDLQRAEPERRVQWSLAPNLSAQADPTLLRAVLENLLGNAWKFTRDQPHARIELDLAEYGGAPAFFVRDNGAGFDLAFADKLFSPFHRLHTVTEFPGTGIGLATVQRIIRRHGGRVWADSELNHGATFWFTLPEQPNRP